MFFGQLVHPEIFQPETDHPMVKRIVGSELVRLFFVSGCFFESAQRSLGAGELIAGQGKSGIALHGISPNRDGFFLAAELPERLAFFLASENQIVALRQGLIETRPRLLVATQTIQNRAAIIETQSFRPVLFGGRLPG